MKRQVLTAIAAALLAAGFMQPAIGGNLLTDSGLESFLGAMPGGNVYLPADDATKLNIWLGGSNLKSANSTTMLPAPGAVPAGWSGNNFAQHYHTAPDITDLIRQGIDGDRVKENIKVDISFKYINTEQGRIIKVHVYGIDGDLKWWQGPPFPCQDTEWWLPPNESCKVLYYKEITVPWTAESLVWHSFADSFTPTTSHAVVAVGIEIGGHSGYARGVDDIVLSQNQPPVCTAAVPSVSTLWTPNHKLVPINILGVTDPDGDPVTITIDGIYQDEPVNGLGDGDTGPDGFGVDTSTAQVRAERAGNGNGRVYNIYFTADDGNGGECMGQVKVGVPKSQGTKGAAIDDGALFDSTVM